MYQVLLSVVVGEGEGGEEVIRTGTTRMPVRGDGGSAFYVSSRGWVVLMSSLQRARSRFLSIGGMGQPRVNSVQKKTESNQWTSPLYIIPNITLQLCTLPKIYLIEECKTACMPL